VQQCDIEEYPFLFVFQEWRHEEVEDHDDVEAVVEPTELALAQHRTGFVIVENGYAWYEFVFLEERCATIEVLLLIVWLIGRCAGLRRVLRARILALLLVVVVSTFHNRYQ
jgi:hypothetical protein